MAVVHAASRHGVPGRDTTCRLRRKTRPPVRWWLLLLCALLAGNQGGTWLIYGVIAEAIKPVFGWDDGTIATIANWGPYGYFVAAWPTSYLLDVAGLRTTAVLASAVLFAVKNEFITGTTIDVDGGWLTRP